MSRPDDADRAAVVDPDYPVEPVPGSARKSFFSIAVVLLGFTVFTPTMLAGAQLGPAFTFADLLVVLLVGSAVLGGYVAVIGYIGARTGLTTVLMARYTLGNKGSKLASLLLGGTQVGWYGVVVGTLGELTAQALGVTSYAVTAVIMVVASALMCLTAYYGYRGMYWVSLVSTPLILVLAVWVVARSLQEVGGLGGLFGITPTASLPFAVAVTIVVGTFASGGTQAPNWTRFARTGGHAVGAGLIGFFLGNGLMILFGAIGALTFGEGDFVLVLYQLGLVGWGLVLLFGNLWKTNADTAYAFGVAGAELFDRRTKGPFVIGGSVIATVLALAGVHTHLVQYLVLLGVLIPPLGGVIIGDWLVRWRGGIPDPRTYAFPAFRWENLAAYALGALVAWGSGAAELGVPPVNGILVAAVGAFLLGRVRGGAVSGPR